jgi:hypothetical protein
MRVTTLFQVPLKDASVKGKLLIISVSCWRRLMFASELNLVLEKQGFPFKEWY